MRNAYRSVARTARPRAASSARIVSAFTFGSAVVVASPPLGASLLAVRSVSWSSVAMPGCGVASTPWIGPRRSVEALAARYGSQEVVGGCLDLLARREVEGHLVLGLGGPPARWATQSGDPGRDYWLRVWALRGLLWLWDDSATQAVITSLSDETWRVREMASKVVARHLLDPALASVAALQQDRVARVRRAAERAVMRLTTADE